MSLSLLPLFVSHEVTCQSLVHVCPNCMCKNQNVPKRITRLRKLMLKLMSLGNNGSQLPVVCSFI